MIALVAATAPGRALAARLVARLDGASVQPGTAAEALAAAWPTTEAIVCCMAVGAAVRLTAPLLGSKHTDPPVVVVDDAGHHAVVLLGAHHGGNALAEQVAAMTGGTAVITTATDVLRMPSLDDLDPDLTVDPAHDDRAAVAGAALAGEVLHRHRTHPWPTGPLPGDVVDVDRPTAPGIVVTDAVLDGRLPSPLVVYRPASLVVGVGASRGVSLPELEATVDTALADAGLSPRAVHHLATVDAKADEPAIRALAAARGWPLRTHPPETLDRIDVPNPSPHPKDAVGTRSVAEAAALADGGELLVPKTRSVPADPEAAAMATVAIARRPVRGRLLLVSTGPGDDALLPPAAREALGRAEVVIGLDQYLDRIRPLTRDGAELRATPIGREVDRARDAIATAREGRVVVLLSGGDIGTYAMGSPTLEELGEATNVDVEVVPGITAATTAAAVLGAPLGHDHCAISLSDLLTPWEVIRRRVKAAAEGDFVVSFYNPRSRGRTWQLAEAFTLLAEHRPADTPVGIVTDASRPEQAVIRTTLADVDVEDVDMRTIVLVGSSQTRWQADRMVTPRGYR